MEGKDEREEHAGVWERVRTGSHDMVKLVEQLASAQKNLSQALVAVFWIYEAQRYISYIELDGSKA